VRDTWSLAPWQAILALLSSCKVSASITHRKETNLKMEEARSHACSTVILELKVALHTAMQNGDCLRTE
jgi:hypothetical protein